MPLIRALYCLSILQQGSNLGALLGFRLTDIVAVSLGRSTNTTRLRWCDHNSLRLLLAGAVSGPESTEWQCCAGFVSA